MSTLLAWLNPRRPRADSISTTASVPASTHHRYQPISDSANHDCLAYRRKSSDRRRRPFWATIDRDWIAFFIFGKKTASINNLIYVVILSAAVDLVGAEVPKGIVLLADITPSLLIKMIAPYFVHRIPYPVRVVFCASLSFSAVVLISMAQTISVRLIGVMMASLSSGLGELTFLMLSSFYPLKMVSAWSSGTGGAGLLGALLFLALTSWIGLSIPRTLDVVAMFPISMLVAYFVLLTSPTSNQHSSAGYRPIAAFSPSSTGQTNQEEELLESPHSSHQRHSRHPSVIPPPSAGPLAALSGSETGHQNGHNSAGEATAQSVIPDGENGNGNSSPMARESKSDVRTHHKSASSIASSHGTTSSPSVTITSPTLPMDQTSISSATVTVSVGPTATTTAAATPQNGSQMTAAPWDTAPWDVPQHHTEPTSINTLLAATDPDDPSFVSPFHETEIEDGSSLASSTQDGRRRRRRVYYKTRPNEPMSFQEKLGMARALLIPFMMPLFLVYVAEYTMNQGVLPVILFPMNKTPFTHMRDTGVFISRSSASLLEISRLWIPSFLQLLTLLLATSQALLSTADTAIPIPSIYLIFALILWEGLLGGATYVHTYIGISKDFEHDPKAKEFALGVVGVADGLGILVAGVASLWIEPALCQWQVVHKGVELCLAMAD
ncbi:battenin CLN3 protein [Mortierella alpina]|nr:battenin CLN3 protein [Mortierella alpina]